ncbi:MAG: histidinol-phosphate transaminase [Gemmataceae bacterium]
MPNFVRPNVRAMAGYVPGEQPRGGAYIKLNTNENPYPPSPRVFEAIQSALTGDCLRKYPDPLGNTFRQAAARVHQVDPECILIGNGSDDILTIVTRAFVPEGGLVVSMTPSYILYRTLADLQNARFQALPYTSNWGLPRPWPVYNAHLTFLTSPNSPSGTALASAEVESLIQEASGPVVLDEAYAAFADSDNLALAKHPHVIVARSMSKAYSLAGMRFGYAVADAALVRELVKVKDSYNCDVLSLAAATAAIEDEPYLQATRAKVLATRARMAVELTRLGFDVCPSQANFLWCRRADRPVKPIYEELKLRMILVRYMNYEGYGDGLRISVGSDSEIDCLLEQTSKIL